MEDVNYIVEYTEKNPEICNASENRLKLLIIVTSAPSHKNLRLAIRDTWGSATLTREIDIAFLLGYTHNKSIEESLLMEQTIYGDLIRASFIDTYDNMTLKTITMLHWANKFCSNAKFLLKADDDTFININRLMLYMGYIPEGKDALYGHLLEDQPPCRDVSSKYYLSFEQYEYEILPTFLSGSSYLLPMHVTEKLLLNAQRRPLFKLEDIFLSGFIAGDLGIPLIHTSMFNHLELSKKSYCYLRSFISVHYVDVKQQYDLWQILLYPEKYCYHNILLELPQ
ncbi:UDP-GalNAc:beta-1,3-N-acetylgalactosaminyltransferase 1-like isoform X2 [Coccinella septempunctata]|nr:UDP-GalNAc:beta-1,3-N-acetylgalactosaminyltransferase 1-like isoform X2 [Coccinella septempunctata]